MLKISLKIHAKIELKAFPFAHANTPMSRKCLLSIARNRFSIHLSNLRAVNSYKELKFLINFFYS